MGETRSRFWHTAREYVTNWAVGGLIIMATGFAPEELMARIANALRIPHDTLHLWAAGIDIRVVAVFLGVAIVVGDLLLRGRALRVQRSAQISGAAARATEPGTDDVTKGKRDGLPLPDKPSIAVLPFENMSGDPKQEYFCDGVVEDILTALSRFSWLFVIARNSSFTYKGKPVGVKQVGYELGVRYVIEGSVRKLENRVRITGQLIEASTGAHLWADRYDRSLDDIFRVQDEIVVAIVGTLIPEIGAVEMECALHRPPQNLDAWDTYQRGLHRYYQFGKEDLLEAQKLFDRAIQIDSMLADPYVFRALTGIAAVLLGYAASPRDVLSEAAGFARQALRLDERNALAHTILGRSLMLTGKYQEAIAENRLAIELNPNLALAHYGLGAALLWAGHAEQSIPHYEQALRLSPRDPISPVWRCVMGQALSFMGSDEAALAAVDAAVRQRPDNAMFLAHRALPLVGLNQLDAARAAVAEALSRNPSFSLSTVAQSFPNLDRKYADFLLNRLRAAGLPE
jgi:adenylate cyclase